MKTVDHLSLLCLVADDVAQGVVGRQHDLALAGAPAVALQWRARDGALALAGRGKARDVDLVVGLPTAGQHGPPHHLQRDWAQPAQQMRPISNGWTHGFNVGADSPGLQVPAARPVMACVTGCCIASRGNASNTCYFQSLARQPAGLRRLCENDSCRMLSTGSRIRATVGRDTPKLIDQVLCPPLGTWTLLGFGFLDSAAQLDVGLQRSP